MSKVKEKKQFRLYDIYRYLSIDKMSSIQGIEQYEVCRDNTEIVLIIEFDTGFKVTHYCGDEQDLKEAVRWINKHLGNCATPGVKSSKRKVGLIV